MFTDTRLDLVVLVKIAKVGDIAAGNTVEFMLTICILTNIVGA